MESNYLVHYGVMGMKWGVRHEPEPGTVRGYNYQRRLLKGSNIAAKYTAKRDYKNSIKNGMSRKQAKLNKQRYLATSKAKANKRFAENTTYGQAFKSSIGGGIKNAAKIGALAGAGTLLAGSTVAAKAGAAGMTALGFSVGSTVLATTGAVLVPAMVGTAAYRVGKKYVTELDNRG